MQYLSRVLLPCCSRCSLCKGKRDRDETCQVWRCHRIVFLLAKVFMSTRVIFQPYNIILVTEWSMGNTDLFQQTSLLDNCASEFFFQDHIIITGISLTEKSTVWLQDHKKNVTEITQLLHAYVHVPIWLPLASLHPVFCYPKENIIVVVVAVLLLLLWLLLNNLISSGKVSEVEELSKSPFQCEVRPHFYDTNSDIDLLWPPHTTLVLNQTGNNPKASRVHMGCYKEHPKRPQGCLYQQCLC